LSAEEKLLQILQEAIESGLGTRAGVSSPWHKREKDEASKEKVTEVFNQILCSPSVFYLCGKMVETGLMAELIPELLRGEGMEQSYIHPDDVLTHNLRTCSLVKPKLNLRLAALLHDVGKPGYYIYDPLVGRRFPKHQLRSGALVPQILNRFAYKQDLVNQVQLLVEHHMFIWRPKDGLPPLKELLQKVGRENIEDLIELVISDREAIWGDRIRESNRALLEAVESVLGK
jgi:tRNA nucleotidyltransferase (CCA-adding enzyme)